RRSLRLSESIRQTEELMTQGRPGFENVGELIVGMNNGEQ
ncbi:type II toxin-antitoxin system antitoxin, RelB/DinJ family, partial [Salmonella enterica]|nr:type II toxin-antitoxin system antitoxin, RelB/DinJ family [Salmonella enterica]